MIIATATLLASSELSDGIDISCPFLKNLIFLKHKSFVRFISLLETFIVRFISLLEAFKYLQE